MHYLLHTVHCIDAMLSSLSYINRKVLERSLYDRVILRKRSGVAFSASSDKLRLAVTVSSWFCLPEEGMKDVEILCRSSAFILKTMSPFSSPIAPLHHPQYHIITVSHGVAPWRWPRQYQMDENGSHAWLRHLNENHTYYTLELRDPESGVFMTQQELAPVVFHHQPSQGLGLIRDLAVLHVAVDVKRQLTKQPLSSPELIAEDLLEQEQEQVSMLQDLGLEIFTEKDFISLSQLEGDDILNAVGLPPVLAAIYCLLFNPVRVFASTATTSALLVTSSIMETKKIFVSAFPRPCRAACHCCCARRSRCSHTQSACWSTACAEDPCSCGVEGMEARGTWWACSRALCLLTMSRSD